MTEAMLKNEAKLTLRYPAEVKEAYKKIAKEEGLSENSALVQALVWALKFREGMNDQKQ
jgi:molybdopterin converting factor small subunit